MYNRGDILNNVYNITAVILAAGEGKRMYSKTPKVLHKVCGISMVENVTIAAREIGCEKPVVVVGHGADQVIKSLEGVSFVHQEVQLGTGHAVMQADEYIGEGDVLVLYGDTPLITPDTLRKMYELYKQNGYGGIVLTADLDDPHGYGRIIRNGQGLIDSIVEERDASLEVKQIREVNSGMYFFNGAELKEALKGLGNNNAQGEYYITDVIKIMKEKGLNIGIYKTEHSEEIMGVNNKLQLSQAEGIMRKRINTKHLLNGVTIIDPLNTYIEPGVKIERDVVIYPGCILEGKTTFGEDCSIGPNSRVKDSTIGSGVTIQNSIVLESTVGEGTSIGPFAHIRRGNTIGKHVRIGDFVEMKNSKMGDFSKASHLAYVGDADVGSNVNLGCGVVFVNYDGKNKNRSKVEDNCFVGCNANIVAPVVIKENSYVAAGTTVVKDVPEESLAIGRAMQENKEGWVRKRK